MSAEKAKEQEYIELVRMWIESSEERMERAKKGNNFSEASIQQSYAEGMKQSLRLFKTIYKD